MDRAKAQAKLNKGYGKLGSKLGREFARYRPSTAHNPISPQTRVTGTIWAYFDPNPQFKVTEVTQPGEATFFGAFDATDVLPGDYFVAGDLTYFVGVMQDLLPPECFACNSTLSFFRPTAHVTDDPDDYYAGNTKTKGKGHPLALNWPAVKLQGTKGDKAILNLPNDVRSPWFSVILPDIPGVKIQTSDQIRDENGKTLLISSVELTRHGQRLTVGYSEA